MKQFQCICDNTLYFDNSECLNCRRLVRFCRQCRELSPIEPVDDAGTYRCMNPSCGITVKRCGNDVEYDVCNWSIPLPNGYAQNSAKHCHSCSFTRTIPDLKIPGNREKWYSLESAKRRLLYTLDLVGLPYDHTGACGLALSFEFMQDTTFPGGMFESQLNDYIMTGHNYGNITINIREADPVEREKARVNLGEPQRTLVGHFRHEIGHYFWDLLISPNAMNRQAFVEAFGNPDSPSYEDALKIYYENGPKAHWQAHYISAYATMHPWEDWAETFSFYLEMISVLETAAAWGFSDHAPLDMTNLPAMMSEFQRLAIAMNEMNHAMGMTDLVPRIATQSFAEKLAMIHRLVQDNRQFYGPVITPPYMNS